MCYDHAAIAAEADVEMGKKFRGILIAWYGTVEIGRTSYQLFVAQG